MENALKTVNILCSKKNGKQVSIPVPFLSFPEWERNGTLNCEKMGKGNGRKGFFAKGTETRKKFLKKKEMKRNAKFVFLRKGEWNGTRNYFFGGTGNGR